MPSIRSTNRRRRNAQFKRENPYYLVDNGYEPRSAELGDVVKIGFFTGFCTEWMWADVVRKEGDDYLVKMCNTGYYGGPFEGDYKRITSQHILTTYHNCPMRAVRDLEPIGGSYDDRLDLLRQAEKTGLTRRQAVEKILADLPKAA